MDNLSEIRKLSCYAVLRMGYTGEDYLIPHMRLVLYLIAKRRYSVIKPQELINDFEQEFKYKIDYFPMLQILSLAVKKGYLIKNNNSKKYTVTLQIDEFSNNDIEKAIQESNHQLDRLIQSFQDFASRKIAGYSKKESEDIVVGYINSQKLEHMTGHIESVVEDKRVDVLFGQFVIEIKNKGAEEFTYLTHFVQGSVLADCLTYHEELKNVNHLSDLGIILDTGLVFRCLGIDLIDRKSYYLNLINSLKRKGAKLYIFRHTYDEMQLILQGALQWVESVNYDPLLSSETTEYFRNEGYKRIDVEEFIACLPEKIKDLEIEKIEIDYTEPNYPYQESEAKLYQMIVEKYKETNACFDENDKRKSIEIDTHSICGTYIKRGGARPRQISDAKFLFVTLNNSLVKVAQNYHSEEFDDSLCTTVSDILIGTYVWLSDPTEIERMSISQIVANAEMAFQPSMQMLNKLVTAVNEAQKKGQIEPDICYLLKSSKYVSEKVMQKTLGDPAEFTDATPLEILEEIREEARNKGIAEMQVIQEKQRLEQEAKEKKEKLRNLFERKEYFIQLKHKNEELIKQKKVQLKGMDERINKIKSKKDCIKRIVVGAVLIMLVAALIWGYYLLKNEKGNTLSYLGVIVAILPFAVGMMYSLKTLRRFDLMDVLEGIMEESYRKQCERLNCSENAYSLICSELKNFEDEIVEYKKEIAKCDKEIEKLDKELYAA